MPVDNGQPMSGDVQEMLKNLGAESLTSFDDFVRRGMWESHEPPSFKKVKREEPISVAPQLDQVFGEEPAEKALRELTRAT